MAWRAAYKVAGSFPRKLLALTLLLTAGTAVWMGLTVRDLRRSVRSFRERDLRITELRGELVHLDEVLTMSARMAAATGDAQWEERYLRFLPQLDDALAQALLLAPELQGNQAVAQTDAANQALLKLEHRAFTLTRHDDRFEAQRILDGAEYATQKELYSDGMRQVGTLLHGAVEQAVAREERKARLQVTAALVLLPLLLGAWALVLRTMRAWEVALAQRTLALVELNRTLDERVAARTAALSEQVEKHSRAEAALKQTAADLARSNTELERFAYVASHDLQGPLRSIAGFTQLLARRYQGRLDPDADEYIGYAVEGAKRMQALLDDLLTFCRLDANGRTFELADCGRLLDAALRLNAREIQETGARITREPLPKARVDPEQFILLLQNLLSNALKFRAAQPVIHVGAAQRDGAWVFSVRDNGIGLEPAYAERIFVIFQRLHTAREYPGTGIGLAVCRKVVERHGGRIWVESEPGKGSTFFFTLAAGAEAGV